MATVIEDFLVRLGFSIDQDTAKKFKESISDASGRLISLGKKGVGAAVAVGAAFLKTSSDVNEFYKLANQTGTSVQGFLTLSGAVERVGGSAQEVNQALSTMANNIKTLPTFRDQLSTTLGVDVLDANNNLRDTSDILLDVQKRLRELNEQNPQQAKILAESVGLGGVFDSFVKSDFESALKRQRELFGELNKTIDDTTGNMHRLRNGFSDTWAIIKKGAQGALGEITKALALDEKLDAFNDRFAARVTDMVKKSGNGARYIADAYSIMYHSSDGAAGFGYKMMFDTDEAQALSSFKNGTLDKEEAEYLAGRLDPDNYRKRETLKVNRYDDNGKIIEGEFDTVEIIRKDVTEQGRKLEQLLLENQGKFKGVSVEEFVRGVDMLKKAIRERKPLEPVVKQLEKVSENLENLETHKKGVETTPKTDSDNGFNIVDSRIKNTLGWKNKNPGNLRASSLAIGKDKQGYAIFKTMEDGYRAMGEQLKMYQNAGLKTIEEIISTYAPQSENNTAAYIATVVEELKRQGGLDITAQTALDLSDPATLKALADAMVNVEIGNGASRYFQQSPYTEQIRLAALTERESKAVNADQSKTVTINQTNNISGVKGAAEAVREIKDSTEAVARYSVLTTL